MKKYTITFFLLPFYLLAQPGETKWDKAFGGSADEQFHSFIEAGNGYLVAVGETKTLTAGGTDGYVVITDYSTGDKLVEKRLGGNRDDGFRSVTQTFDGYFLLAGYTASAGKGKSDGWLVLIDERGNTLWEQTYGTPGDDAFENIVRLPDGSIVAAGRVNDGKSGDIWLTAIRDKTQLWEQMIGAGHFGAVTGLARADDGGFVLAGNTQKSAKRDKGDAFLVKTLPNGQVQWEKFFGGKDWEETTDLIITRDGSIAFCGLSTSSDGAGEMDMWLVKTNASGYMQWEKYYGGKDVDMANGLSEDPDGGFLVVGGTKSHRSGARQFKAFLVKTDGGGIRQWEYNLGDHKDDTGAAVGLLHDGSIVMAGNTASKGAGGNDGWLVCWSGSSARYAQAMAGAKQAGLEFSPATLHTTDGELKPNDRTYLSFDIANTTGADLANVQAKITARSYLDGLQWWETNFIGFLPKDGRKQVHIPIRAGANLPSGEAELGVTLMVGNEARAEFPVRVKAKKPLEAAAEIDNYTFDESRTSDVNTLTVVVKNPGDYEATPVTVSFELPTGLQAKSALNVNLGSIPAHGSRPAQISYVKTSSFRSGKVAINCEVKIGAATRASKVLEAGAGGPAAQVDMILTKPNETLTDIQNMVTDRDEFDLQVAIGASNLLRQQDIKIVHNNQRIDGSKMDEVDLSSPKQLSGRFHYVYNSKIKLQPGKNEVVVELETPTGQFRTHTIVVNFEPRQPNLHILAIGPTHQDLKYTSKDAGDFATAFANQAGAGKLFNQVFTRQLVTVKETEADAIREAVSDLVYQYTNPAAARKISQNDILIVFISSHGKNDADGFKLLPSNYDQRYERTRTIDFQNDVVRELERIHCKKIVMIDACQSGAADSKTLSDQTRAEALMKLAAMHPGMSTLTSCRSSELSYEDQSWQNGAFTKAILEAFADIPVSDQQGPYKADVNNNRVITLGELYTFLQRRVPHLVKTQKPNAQTTQTPFMPGNQLDKEDLSIYVVE